MSKKLTLASKWKNERWFRLLLPEYKLVLCYLEGICDIDGTWPINCPDLIDDLRIQPSFNLQEFITACNTDYDILTGVAIEKQRIVKVGDSILWLTGYIKLQLEDRFEQINPSGNYAKASFKKLAGKGVLFEGIQRGWVPLPNPYLTLIDGVDKAYARGLYIYIDIDRDKNVLRRLMIDDGEEKGGKAAKGGSKGKLKVIPGGQPPAEDDDDSPGPTEEIPEMTQKEFAEFEEKLLTDGLFINPIMISRGIASPEDLRLWLAQFHAQIVGDDNLRKDYKEYRKHFRNWIKLQEGTFSGPPKKLNGKHVSVAGSATIPAITDKDLEKYKKKQQ